LVKLLARIGELEIQAVSGGARPAGSIGLVGSGFEAFVYIAEAVDMALLKQKFTKDIEKDHKFILALEAKLINQNFLKNAPPELVVGERAKLEDALKRISKLEAYIKDMA
jgi:valyl-tRNA synthetase